ncbi:SMI1/KNR4 family protein [Pseudocolwellia sp. HL-MZ7]|uniref:SMI1/KNR4 family protein n=1 Tax=Pseudocolwellia sp. HL-MZ7 TaxID=3400627 RepID=UPI003CE99F85
MIIEMESIGPKINSDDIKDLELKLNLKFPESYKRFLLECNGGEPVERAINFKIKGNSFEGDYIASFYEVSDDTSYGINKNMENHGLNIPDKLIYIASTPAGNYFLLSLQEDSYGNVFYKNHEVEDHLPFAPANNILPESIIKIANTFDEFLSFLYDPDQ